MATSINKNNNRDLIDGLETWDCICTHMHAHTHTHTHTPQYQHIATPSHLRESLLGGAAGNSEGRNEIRDVLVYDLLGIFEAEETSEPGVTGHHAMTGIHGEQGRGPLHRLDDNYHPRGVWQGRRGVWHVHTSHPHRHRKLHSIGCHCIHLQELIRAAVSLFQQLMNHLRKFYTCLANRRTLKCIQNPFHI